MTRAWPALRSAGQRLQEDGGDGEALEVAVREGGRSRVQGEQRAERGGQVLVDVGVLGGREVLQRFARLDQERQG